MASLPFMLRSDGSINCFIALAILIKFSKVELTYSRNNLYDNILTLYTSSEFATCYNGGFSCEKCETKVSVTCHSDYRVQNVQFP